MEPLNLSDLTPEEYTIESTPDIVEPTNISELDPSEYIVEEPDLLEQAVQKRQVQDKESLLEFGAKAAPAVLEGFGEFLSQGIPDIIDAALHVGKQTMTGDVEGAYKNIKTGAKLAITQYPQLWEQTKRFVQTKLGEGYSDDEIRQQIRDDLKFQEEQEKILGEAENKQAALGLSVLEDPVNLATAAIPFKGIGNVVRGGLKSAGIALPEAGTVGLTRKALSKTLTPIGEGLETAGRGVETAREKLHQGAAKIFETPALQEAAANKVAGMVTSATVGGVPGAATYLAPEFLKTAGTLTQAAARELVRGERSVPFFRAVARDAQLTPSARLVAQMMDQSGFGEALIKASRVTKEGAKGAALMSWFATVTSGGDPEVAGQQLGTMLGFGMAGAGLHELTRGESRALIQKKQVNDIAVMLAEYAKDPKATQVLADFMTNSPNKADMVNKLTTLAQYKALNPDATITLSADGMSNFDRKLGEIEINLMEPDVMGRVIGHEIVHEQAAAGKLDAILQELTGIPELGKEGVLMDSTGKAKPEFEKFIKAYGEKLYAGHLKRGEDPRMAAAKTQAYVSDLPNMANEWLAENIGTLMTARTGKGELLYTRIARKPLWDAWIENRLTQDPSWVKYFGVDLETLPQARWESSAVALPPKVRNLYLKAVRSGTFEAPRGKEFQYRKGQEFTANFDDLKRNIPEAQKIVGTSDEIVVQPDRNGKLTIRARNRKEVNQRRQEQSKLVENLLAEPPVNTEVLQKRSREDVKGNTTEEFTGTELRPEWIEAMRNSGVYNEAQMALIDQLAPILSQRAGIPIEAFYYTASDTGAYRVTGGRMRELVPYEWLFTPAKVQRGKRVSSVLNLRVLDLEQVRDNFRDAVERANRMKEGVPFSSEQDFLQALQLYTENHRRGYGGMGNELADQPRPTQPPAGQLTEIQRNFINETLGTALPSNEGRNAYRERLREAGQKLSRSAIKSFRLDRMSSVTPIEGARYPVSYYPEKFNYSPTGRQEFTKRPSTEELKKFSTANKDLFDQGYTPKIKLDNLTGKWSAEMIPPDGKQFSPAPVKSVRELSDRYMEENKLTGKPYTRYEDVNPELGKKLADQYETLKHDPENPAVKSAYNDFKSEILKQWDFMTQQGKIKAEPWRGEGQPYKDSAEMKADVEKNKHLWFFPTEAGYGQGEKLAHPLLEASGVKVGGIDLPYNDLFRAIHDYYGHAKEGYGFGPKGEWNAYLAHKPMFTENAVKALTMETAGQNSWVNFGKHIRRENGEIPKPGEPDYIHPAERPFAEQKANILYLEGKQFSPQEEKNILETPLTIRQGIEPLQKELVKNQGLTWDLKTNQTQADKGLFAVSPFPDRTQTFSKPPTTTDMILFTRKNKDLLSQPDLNLGGWFNSKDKQWYLDVTYTTPDRDLAQYLGKQANQISFSELDSQKGFPEIQLGGTGKVNRGMPKASERIDLWRSKFEQDKELGPGKLFSPAEKENAPVFFSKLAQVVREKMPNKASVDQIRGLLGESVKQEELDWTGFRNYLEQNKGQTLTKDQVLDYIDQNQVRVNEILKDNKEQSVSINRNSKYALPQVIKVANEAGSGEGDLLMTLESDGDAYRALTKKFPELATREDWAEVVVKDVFGGETRPEALTKFDQYTLPGGENYKELLFTLPVKEPIYPKLTVEEGKERGDLMRKAGQLTEADFARLKELNRKAQLHDEEWSRPKAGYHSSHYDEPNILAHVRFNEREVGGKKILFIEEVQSDWHQTGREGGYEVAPKDLKLEDFQILHRPKENQPFVDQYWVKFNDQEYGPFSKENVEKHREGLFKDYKRGAIKMGQVPDAPFKKNWHELVMKRMLRYAAENGFDKVAWTTGEQQAARYDLSKQIDRVVYYPETKGVSAMKDGNEVFHKKLGNESELADLIGKDAAKNLLAVETNDKGFKSLEGQQLKIGGEGMKGFYDKMLPSFMDKYGKKFGAKVETIEISGEKLSNPRIKKEKDGSYTLLTTEGPVKGFTSRLEIREYIEDQAHIPVHSIPVTHSMKNSVMKEGQPLFSPSDVQLEPKKPLENALDQDEVRILHLSSKENLTKIDPKFFGKGLATSSDLRGGHKSFFFVEGSKTGGDAFWTRGKNVYGATISGKGLYDLSKSSDDPLGWRSNPNREAADDALRRAGYTGIYVETPDNRKVVALFRPISVTRLGIQEQAKKALVPNKKS